MHGGNGGVEFVELILILTVTGDVSSDSPITQVDGGVTQELVV